MGLKATLRRSALDLFRRRIGYDISRYPPRDIDESTMGIVEKTLPYSLATPDRAIALISAVRYVVERGVPGAMVECGVAQGGSMLAIAEALTTFGDTTRSLYLYDTFEGMPAATGKDITASGRIGVELFQRFGGSPDGSQSDWIRNSEDVVRTTMARSSYPADQIEFVKGLVEETIPGTVPEGVALLRLDTDFYTSTRHELEHLAPLVASGGIVLIDDYGFWQGSREATDEWAAKQPVLPYLHRIDDSARMIVMP